MLGDTNVWFHYPDLTVVPELPMDVSLRVFGYTIFTLFSGLGVFSSGFKTPFNGVESV